VILHAMVCRSPGTAKLLIAFSSGPELCRRFNDSTAGLLLPNACWYNLRKCNCQLFRLKTKGPRLALIGNAALRVDQIDAVGPARIGFLRRISERVEHGGKLNTEFPHASPSDECTVFFSFRTRKDNLVFDIALHLPNVAGMRLGNVDNQERNSLAVLLVKFIEGRNLPPERRSRIASEHQNHGLPAVQRGELNRNAFVHLEK